jgi:hypothetical protein
MRRQVIAVNGMGSEYEKAREMDFWEFGVLQIDLIDLGSIFLAGGVWTTCANRGW